MMIDGVRTQATKYATSLCVQFGIFPPCKDSNAAGTVGQRDTVFCSRLTSFPQFVALGTAQARMHSQLLMQIAQL